ncbi:MAG: S9 family peptidase [Salinivirgaceae bacterium]|jgi:dipeptidyl-peptidase-4|nr:S9 family peptidase [Salinivirgaceae bacterium]
MKILLIASFLIISTFQLYAQEVEKKNVTLEDIYTNWTYYPQSVYGLTSMNDGLHYSTLVGDSIIAKFSYKTGDKVADIVSVKDFSNDKVKEIDNYTFNSDETKLLFYINRNNIYRHSFTATYYVWDLIRKKLFSVSNKGDQRLATLSPDGSKVAFVRNNNIYISNLATGTETVVTTDGEWNKIINGAPDWVYEEEFEYTKAFEWSPNGDYLAYCKFDESKVPVFNMTVYKGLKPEKLENALYPENQTFKYPKAGEVNSDVSVYSYQIALGKTVKVDVGTELDQYIMRLKWSPNGKMVVYRENRLQNKLEFLYANPQTGESEVFYTENNERYIDEAYFDNLTFLNGGSQFIYASERDGYVHIYLHNADGTLVKQITQGNWDVTEYIGYDAKNKLIFYQSAQPTPMQRSIYSIKLDGSGSEKLNAFDGSNYAIFSEEFKYFINYHSNVLTPNLVTLHNAKGKQIRVLEGNEDLKEKLTLANIASKDFFAFKTSEGVELNGWMIKPSNFDASKKYPVLMIQYSGPNSQEVLDEFYIGWEQILAAEGYIVACVDGRGTGARGEEFRKMTYLQLGKYETIDQIESAKYLGGLDYIDAQRIGIWGWSYGGFMALNCMTQGADYFKMGIAVAPVTSWRYYDNIYTERFMRTPQENPEGYDDNSPINHVDKLKGKLLIVHGTADDNVHLQNSIEISEALVQANKQFEQFYYTNRNHSISGGNTRVHLYTKMINFTRENL